MVDHDNNSSTTHRVYLSDGHLGSRFTPKFSPDQDNFSDTLYTSYDYIQCDE